MGIGDEIARCGSSGMKSILWEVLLSYLAVLGAVFAILYVLRVVLLARRRNSGGSETRMSAKPWWWKPLWIAVLLSTIALGAVDYFLFHVPLERVAGALAITLLAIGFAYYIRIKPSTKVNRATYIMLGIFGTFLVTLFGGGFIIQAIDSPPIPTYLTYLWSWLSFIVLMIASSIAGAFIGDWIGKRMNYRLPLSLGDETMRVRKDQRRE